MRKKIDLETAVAALRKDYNLEVVSPFTIKVHKAKAEFDCLVRGYGSKNGMVIDRYWSKISPLAEQLTDMGYGYSCFDLRGGVENMNEALEDWGKL